MTEDTLNTLAWIGALLIALSVISLGLYVDRGFRAGLANGISKVARLLTFKGKQSTPHVQERPQTHQLLCVAGALALFVGAFSPILSVPVFGSVTFIQHGNIQGIALLVLAGGTLTLSLLGRFGLVVTAGVASLLLVLAALVRTLLLINDLRSSGDGGSGMFTELAETMARAVQLQWGWGLLGFGVLLIIGAATNAMRGQSE